MMDKHPLAGKRVRLRTWDGDPLNGQINVVEDWWANVKGPQETSADESPAMLHYMVRSELCRLPVDELVVYGKVGALAYIVHEREIEAVA